MTRPVTLAELRTRALRAADMTTNAQLQYLPQPEQDSLINESYSDLWDEIVKAYEDYLLDSWPVTTSPGTSSYPLPGDFYKARNLLDGSGCNVEWFEEHERARLMQGFARKPKAKIDGTPSGPALTILPAAGSAQMTLRYIPQPAQLTNDSDIINPNIPAGWETLIVYSAAVKFRRKAALDSMGAESNLATSLKKLQDMRGQRQASGQRRVRDVYGWSRLRGKRR